MADLAAAPAFFTIQYYNEEFYNMSKTLDIVCWLFPIVLSVAVWDWIVNFTKEYERIWRRDFSIVTIFYAGSRYWTLICLSYLVWMYTAPVHSFAYCEKWFRWSCGMTIPIELFSGGILLIRTYAFTGRKLYYLVAFILMYLAMFGYMIYVTIVALQLIPWMVVGQTTGRCVTAGYTGNHIATGFWVAPLGFSFVLTTVTLIHSVRLRQRMPAAKRSPLFRVFVRDGLMYLAVVTLTNVLNVAFFTQKTPELEGAAMAFQFLLSSLMSCQLVLSLRDAEVRNLNSACTTLATKSFWKTGYTGASPSDYDNGSTQNNSNTYKVSRQPAESVTSIPGGVAHSEHVFSVDTSESKDSIPLHNVNSGAHLGSPIQVQIDRHREIDENSEKAEYIATHRY